MNIINNPNQETIKKINNYNKVIKYKTFSLFCIKYGPVCMSITCASKIFLLNISNHINTIHLFIVNIINLLLNLIILLLFYCLGKYFNYCKGHHIICYHTAFGYIMYFIFIVFNINKFYTIPFSIIYIINVIIITIYYYWCILKCKQ